jgi:argininosuccinate synthase
MHGLIRTFDDLAAADPDAPVVTLFSGGLDSAYLLYRLRQAGFQEVHAFSVDLGDDETSADKLRITDLIGARLHMVDGRERFAAEFVRPAIAAQATYLGNHPISSSLSRPLIASLAVDFAASVGARVLLHTANRSQNTLRRLNGAIRLLGFDGIFGSPYDLDPVDRERKIRELAGTDLRAMTTRLVSFDSNLWCREFESGILEDPEDHVVPEQLYRWSAQRPVDGVDVVEIGFSSGVPTHVDGQALPLTELIAMLNERVGRHGIGRYSGLEHIADGVKVLEIREMPAATVLLATARHLENATLDAETIREKMHVEQLWVREALEGRWFGDLRRAAQSFVDVCAARVTGAVRLTLGPGRVETCRISAARPLYLRDREEWERRTAIVHGPVWVLA